MVMSAGRRFRAALDAERPLQIVGAINAVSALMAKQAGFLLGGACFTRTRQHMESPLLLLPGQKMTER